MTPKRISLALLCFALAWPTAARAGLITWELGGTINQVSPVAVYIPYPGPRPILSQNPQDVIAQLGALGVSAGGDWHGRVAFESGTPAEPCGGCVDNAAFLGATKSIEFFAGSFAAHTPGGVVGDASSRFFVSQSSSSSYLIFNSPLASNSTALLADRAAFAFVSGDPDEVLYTALPTEPPDLVDLAYVDVVVFGRGLVPNDEADILAGGPALIEQHFRIQGHVTGVTPVPEPSICVLVLAAAGAIALRRRLRALP